MLVSSWFVACVIFPPPSSGCGKPRPVDGRTWLHAIVDYLYPYAMFGTCILVFGNNDLCRSQPRQDNQ